MNDGTTSRQRESGTKARARRHAGRLLAAYGFNGFSLQNVADGIGIRKPSLFNHYDSKEAMVVDLLKEYKRRFQQWATSISLQTPQAKLSAFFSDVLFLIANDENRLCPVTVLIGDYGSMTRPLRQNLKAIFTFERAWLQTVIRQGQRQGLFRKDIQASALVDLVMASALGIQLVARIDDAPTKVRKAVRPLLRLLEK